MSQTFLEDIPEFLEIQRNSFLRILDTGLIEALEKINPISTNSGSKYGLLFYPKDYVLVLPENTITEAFLQGKTYGCKIYVPAIVYEAEKSTSKLKNKFVPIQRNVPSPTQNLNSNHKNKKYVKKNISSFRKTHEASEAFPKKLTPRKLANSLEITGTLFSNKAMEWAYSAYGELGLALASGLRPNATLDKGSIALGRSPLARTSPNSTLNLLMPKVSNRFISYLTQKSTVLNLNVLKEKKVKPLELLECAPILEHTDGAKDVKTFSNNFASKSTQSRGISTSNAILRVEPELFEKNINFDLRKAKNRWGVIAWSKKPTYAQKIFFRQSKDTTKKDSSVNANSVKAKGFLKKKKTILIQHSLTEKSRKDTSSNINPIFFQEPLILPKPIVNVIGQHHIQFFKPSLHFLLQTVSNRVYTQPLTLQTVQKSLKKYWSVQKDFSKKDIDKKKFLSLKALRPLDSIREVQGLGKAIALRIASSFSEAPSEAPSGGGQAKPRPNASGQRPCAKLGLRSTSPNAVATTTKVSSGLMELRTTSASLGQSKPSPSPQASARTLGAQGLSSGFVPNLGLGLLESSKKLLECNLWWQWTKYKTAKGLNVKPDRFSLKSQRGNITFGKTLEDLRYTGSAKLAEERSSFDTENINSDLFVPQQLSKKEWVCVGMLPLMTPRGHFIINGSHRIVVSQMSRAPGLYYQTGEKVQATVVPSKGAWLRLSLKVNENGDIKIWVRITPQRKMPYKVFIETYKYLENLKNPLLRSKALQSKFLNLTYKTINSKIKHFDKHYAVGVISSQINRTLLSFSSYTLGNLGRKRINERLGINENKGYLTSKDLYFIKKNLIKGLYENFTGLEDDIDHLKNRRVRTCGELLQTEIEIGLVRLKKAITKQLDEYLNPNLYTTLKTRNSNTLDKNYTINKQNHLDKKKGFEKAKALASAFASGLVMQSKAFDQSKSNIGQRSQLGLAKHLVLAKPSLGYAGGQRPSASLGLRPNATLALAKPSLAFSVAKATLAKGHNTQQGGIALPKLMSYGSSPGIGLKGWPKLVKQSRGPESMPILKPNLNSCFINTVDCKNPNFYLRYNETDYNFTGVKSYLSLQKYLLKRKLSRVLEFKKVFLGELGQKEFELRKMSLLVSKNQNLVQWPQRVGIDLALNKTKNQELSILKNPSRILGQNLYANYDFSDGLDLRSRDLLRNTDYTKAGALPVISKPYYDLEPVVKTLLKNHKLTRHGSKALVFAGQIHSRLSPKSNLSESGTSWSEAIRGQGQGSCASLSTASGSKAKRSTWPKAVLYKSKPVAFGHTLEAKLATFPLPPYTKGVVQTSGVLNKEGFFNSWVFPQKTNYKGRDSKKSKSITSEVLGQCQGSCASLSTALATADKSYKNVPKKPVGKKKELAPLSDPLQSNSKEESLIGKSLSYKKYDEGLFLKSGKKKNALKSDNFERNQNFFPIASPSKLVGTKAFAGALREFFGSNPLSQYMDQTNPLAEITHKRRLSSLGPGGVDRASAGIAIRGIHPSHYGRICPIETPEGKNAGLVNSMTMWTRVNKDGFLETPYLKVKGGSIMSHNNHLVSQWHFVPTKKEGHYIRKTNYVSQEGLEILDIGNGVAELSAGNGQSPNLVGGFGQRPRATKALASCATLSTAKAWPSLGSGHSPIPTVAVAKKKSYKTLAKTNTINDYQTLASSFLPESQASQTLEFQGTKIVASDLNFSESSFLPHILLPSRDGSERSFGRYKRDAIDFCGVSPLQNISVATSLIPFLEHDDATRALMGSNMQRQAVPLLKAKGPLVRTGLEGKVVGESGHALQATVGGIISTATRSFISIDIFTKEKKVYGPLYSEGLQNRGFASRALTQTLHTQTGYTKISKSKGLSCFKNFQKPYYSKGSKEVNFLAYLHSSKGLKDFFRAASKVSSECYAKPLSLTNWEDKAVKVLSQVQVGSKYLEASLTKYGLGGLVKKPNLVGTASATKALASLSLALHQNQGLGYATSKLKLELGLNFTSQCRAWPGQCIGLGKALLKTRFAKRAKLWPKATTAKPLLCFSEAHSKPTIQSSPIEPNEIHSLEYLNESRDSLGSCYAEGSVRPLIANFARGFTHMGSLLGTQIWRKNSQINRQRKIQNLQQYTRSNQATICVQRPAVSEGHWVQKGDLIGDCSASQKGVLSLGQNIVVAYLPMEGFNFEDAIVVSDRLVHEELYTSIHIQRVEFDMDAVIKKQIPPKIKLKKQKSAYKTIQQDWITQKNPHLLNSEKKSLNSLGIIKIGSWVGPGDVLVSKVFPVERKIAPSRHLLLAVFQEKKTKTLDTEDTSLRVPKGIHGRVINVKIVGNGITSSIQNPKDQSLKKSSKNKTTAFLKNNGFLINKEKEWKPPVQFAPVRTRTLVKASRAYSTPKGLLISDRGLYKTFRKNIITKETPLTTKAFRFDGATLWPKALLCFSEAHSVGGQGLAVAWPRSNARSITKQNLKNKVDTKKLDFLDGLTLRSPKQPLSDYRPLIEHKFNRTLKNDFDELGLNAAPALLAEDLAFGLPKVLTFGASKALAVGASKGVASLPKASVHSKAFGLTAKALTREQSANILTLGPLNHKTWAKVWVQARTTFLTVNYRQALDVWPGSWIFGSPQQGLGQCKSSINAFGQVQEKTQYEKSWTFTKKPMSLTTETLSEKLNSAFAPKTKHSQDPPFVTSSTESFGNEATDAPSKTLVGTRTSSEVVNPVLRSTSYSTSFSEASPLSTGQNLQRWGFASKASEAKGGVQENQLLHKNFVRHRTPLQEYKIVQIRVYIAERKKLQVGDKMSGRHGNKGIVSTILPREDMPYLPDGTSVDMVLNPLGIPSRMNVGQVFECLLGLAASVCGETIGHTPFDEMYGPEASRSLVYLFLYIARVRARRDWLFQPNFPGKTILFDGRTGTPFEQWVTVGRAYMLKLIHMVDEKIHARSIGPRSLVTQQPVKGRARGGGQRLGEMELWALEGFGAAYTLQEILTLKSDDIKGRENVEKSIIYASTASAHIPETFRMMLFELRSLCLNVELN